MTQEKSDIMRYTLLFVLLFCQVTMVAQGDALKKANQYFKEKNYRNALLEISKIPQAQTSAPLIFKKAICQYELNELDKALAGLNTAENIGFKDDEMLYYKGRILHHKGNFKQAIKSYKAYLEEIDLDDQRRPEVRDHIRHAGAGIDILYIDPIATIENAGAEINSTQNDERLIQSSGKESRFYFNSDRTGKSSKVADYLSKSYDLDVNTDVNVFFTEKNNNTWSRSEKLADRSVNTYKNDQLLGLSMDGQSIYLLRGKIKDALDSYDLVAQNSSPIVKNRIKALTEIVGFVKDFHFFNDSTIVFSSNKLKGQGGYDLFVTAYANGGWLTPKNLGRQVNTANDEVTPYLSNDGSMLYFSSNRSFSVGGMDIFRSHYLFEQGKWTVAKNVGLPINSTGNETHFRLSDDGLIATYTSDRKDGYGKNDIYFAYLNEREEHQSYTVKNLGFVEYPDFYIDKIQTEDVVKAKVPISDKKPNAPIIVRTSKPEVTNVATTSSSILFPILTPNPDGELLSKKNLEKLDALASEINSADINHLEIMSFSHQEGIAEYNLFLSIKTAEKIKEALVERGVEAKKLHIKGYGNYLPIIKSNVTDRNVAMLNNRIQFKVNLADENLESQEAPLDVNKNYLNKGYDIFKTLIDDAISYKIQIATVRQMYRGTALRLYNDVQVEKDENTGNYLYSVGLYDNFIEANSIMRELSEYGVTSLKIVPFVDGLRVDEKDLVNYASEYPALKEYIRSMTFNEVEEE